ncbi:related to TY1B TY1B protein [Rhynchosporium graminicola]|uniref:Related to TY1B TY1B protein n=1 Tax=Rhynchosporium graminicola TaxID=2792576 RepID=A0A1E1KBV5_9HELO|nr:related to TY1B TY1B protein [Rhynchosporium commune]
MQLDGRQVLHIVDQGTTFQNGGFLTNISAEHVWNRFKQVWIDTYLGPPDFIVTDAGTQFKSKEFVQSAKTEGSTVKVVPVEAHHSIGKVERYHGPLKRAYTIIRKELPHLSQDMALQMAFHAINCISGPSGIVPVLLVFGAYPRMVEMDAPSPSVSQRAAALHKAIEEIRKLRSRRQVNDALNTRNGPSSTVVRDLPLNSLVLVWREKGFWDGPWPLISTDGENCVVEIDSGPTTFRSTSIKPWYEEDIDSDEPESIIPEIILVPSLSTTKSNRPILVPKKQPHRDRRKPIRFRDDNVEVYLNYTDELFIGFPVVEPQYAASRRKEIDGLIAAGIFELVHKDELPAGARVFNAKFIDQTKFEGTQKAYEKSRLVVQAYNDSGKNQVLTTSPTIQRVSQRLLLVYAVMHPEFKVYSRDITQAYTQSTSHLIRDFFVRPPKEILAWLHWFLRCVGPMYGVPESANHWFGTYHGHKVKKLHMVPSTFDTCLLSVSGEAGTGALGLQIDDTFFVGNKTFIDAEERELQKAGFKSNEREQLTTLHPIDFNGGHITLETDGSIRLSQQSYDKTLRIIEKEPVNLTNSRGGIRQGLTQIEQFAAQRARGSYLATVSQPEASFDVSFAAQTMNPTEKDFELLNKRILWQKLNCSKGLRYVKLDKKSLKLVVFTDGSFANLKDFHSQIGYVCVLTDKYNKANVIHWSSVCCKRVTRSVLASELYAMSEGFDMAGAIKTTIEQIMEITVLPLIMVTDSKSLYDCVVRLNTTREKRLMIDLMCLRQAYERKEISEVIWVAGPDNPADAMTKTNCNGALKELLHTNQLVIKPMEWVDRGNLDDLKPEESL